MKKNLIIFLTIFTLFSCEKNEVISNQNSEIESFEIQNRIKNNFLINNTCGIEFSLDHEAFYNVFNQASVNLIWEGSNFDIDCSNAAGQFIQVSNTVNGGCFYENVDEFYPIDFFNDTNYTINNINILTDTPYYVPNPNSPTGYNEIYGSKCFYWRIALFNVSCQNEEEICQKEVYSDWLYFEFDI